MPPATSPPAIRRRLATVALGALLVSALGCAADQDTASDAPIPAPTATAAPAPTEPLAEPAEAAQPAIAAGYHANDTWSARMAAEGDTRRLTVEGEVVVPSPGHEPSLVARAGAVEPNTLLLGLVVEAQPGMWTQVLTPKPVSLELNEANPALAAVRIEYPDGYSVRIPIER